MLATMDPVLEFLQQSNAIEGVYDHTSLLDSLDAWKFIFDQDELTTENVLKTHKILMKSQPLAETDKGKFRTVGVWISNRQGLSHSMIPEMIAHWVALANRKKKVLEADIREYHILYEKIHAFRDGNGRTGRIFMNWQRLRCKFPLLTIKAEERHSYYAWYQA